MPWITKFFNDNLYKKIYKNIQKRNVLDIDSQFSYVAPSQNLSFVRTPDKHM